MNRFILILVQMGAWTILMSCGQTATPPLVTPLAKIRIGCGVVNPDASPVWVAEESGFFKKNGITIEDIVPYRGNTPTIQALVSGDIQFAITSPPAVIENVRYQVRFSDDHELEQYPQLRIRRPAGPHQKPGPEG